MEDLGFHKHPHWRSTDCCCPVIYSIRRYLASHCCHIICSSLIALLQCPLILRPHTHFPFTLDCPLCCLVCLIKVMAAWLIDYCCLYKPLQPCQRPLFILAFLPHPPSLGVSGLFPSNMIGICTFCIHNLPYVYWQEIVFRVFFRVPRQWRCL